MSTDNANPFKEEIDKFFSRISDITTKFAQEYNLLIEKYPQQGPNWFLKFAHPKGGEAYVKVQRIADNIIDISASGEVHIKQGGIDDNMIDIQGYWILDVLEESKRYIKFSAPTIIPISLKELLYPYLSKELSTILSWEKGQWSDVVKDMKHWYQRTDKLPSPLIKNPLNDKFNDYTKTIIICGDCKHKNIFNQPYPLSAGFGDKVFLYNDDGNLTLTVSIYDKTFDKLFPSSNPWTTEQRRKLEEMLLPAPKGGRWRFENFSRCMKCKEKIFSPKTGSYLLYEGSVRTDELEDGLAGVLKKK